MSKDFQIIRDVDLPGTAEQAWTAVATDQGSAGWLFPIGGDVPGEVGAVGPIGQKVLAHDHPRHLIVRTEGENGFYNELEYEFMPRDDGTVRMRYVHSGILMTDDWESQYDGANLHTDFYLHSLAQYLTHFAGMAVTYVAADGPDESKDVAAYAGLIRALGLGAAPAVGDSVMLEVPGLEPVRTEVDYVLEGWFLGLRSQDALYRFYSRGAQGAPLSAAHHHFGGKVDAEAHTAAWKAWLAAACAPAPA